MNIFGCLITNYLSTIILQPYYIITKISGLVSPNKKIKYSDMCPFQCHNIWHIDIVRNPPNVYIMDFHFDHSHHIILHTHKLTFISFIFNLIMNIIATNLFMLTNFVLFLQSKLWFRYHHLLQVQYWKRCLLHLKTYL